MMPANQKQKYEPGLNHISVWIKPSHIELIKRTNSSNQSVGLRSILDKYLEYEQFFERRNDRSYLTSIINYFTIAALFLLFSHGNQNDVYSIASGITGIGLLGYVVYKILKLTGIRK